MKNPWARNENGAQETSASRVGSAKKTIDHEIRDLIDCEDVLAGQAAIDRIAARQKEAPSATVFHTALVKAGWKRPELLPRLVAALLPYSDAKYVGEWGMPALAIAMERCQANAHSERVDADLETARLLAPWSDGADRDFSRRTPLMRAASEIPELVEALIPISDAKAADIDGHTALMHAARRCNVESVRLLLPHSDPDARCMRGRPALFFAAEQIVYFKCRDLRAFELLASLPAAPIAWVLRSMRSRRRHLSGHELVGWAHATDVLLAQPAASLRSAKEHVAWHGDDLSLYPRTRQRIAQSEAAALAAAFDLARIRQDLRARRSPSAPSELAREPTPRVARRL